MKEKLYKALVDALARLCLDEKAVSVPDFGVFVAVKRDERIASLPGDERLMLLPPRIVLALLPASSQQVAEKARVTLPQLAQALASETGEDKLETEVFLRSLFREKMAEIMLENRAEIKRVGSFKGIFENDSDSGEKRLKRISFIPDKELAKAVNAPFEIFEAVPYNGPIAVSQPKPAEASELPKGDLEQPEEASVLTEEVHGMPQVEWNDEAEEEVAKEAETPAAEPEPAPVPPALPLPEQPTPAPAETLTGEEPEDIQQPRTRFGWGFAFGFIAAVLLVGVLALIFYFVYWQDKEQAPEVPVNVVNTLPAPEDTDVPIITPEELQGSDEGELPQEAAPTEPTGKKASGPVYDTITKTRYLTTMAKEHYGNYHLWCYIYMENQNFLGHPDRIKPGTQVVVPDLAKYGVDPTDPDDIAKAKKLDAEIYSRYK